LCLCLKRRHYYGVADSRALYHDGEVCKEGIKGFCGKGFPLCKKKGDEGGGYVQNANDGWAGRV